MRILTQNNGGLEGYHGTIGTPTNMFDSEGNPLFIGDVVEMFHANTYPNLKTEYQPYGVGYVCEENIEIADWTGKNSQYVMGLASLWNNHVFEEHPVDFSIPLTDSLTNTYWKNTLRTMPTEQLIDWHTERVRR